MAVMTSQVALNDNPDAGGEPASRCGTSSDRAYDLGGLGAEFVWKVISAVHTQAVQEYSHPSTSTPALFCR